MRVQRGWSQIDLANKLGIKTQSAVARMEDPSYGKLSINTLLKLSSVFDVALSIRFQSFGKFMTEREDLSSKALQAEGFEDDKLIHSLLDANSYTKAINTQIPTSVHNVIYPIFNIGTGSSILSSFEAASSNTLNIQREIACLH